VSWIEDLEMLCRLSIATVRIRQQARRGFGAIRTAPASLMAEPSCAYPAGGGTLNRPSSADEVAFQQPSARDDGIASFESASGRTAVSRGLSLEPWFASFLHRAILYDTYLVMGVLHCGEVVDRM
jgi:hypothetical protein